MKIVVINLTGNAGKTTIAKHMLAPQIPGAKRVQIEDTNMGDGEPDQEVSAKKFKLLAADLNIADVNEHFVIDIGASNAKQMIANFEQLKSTCAKIDFWVIPVCPSKKHRGDSLSTLEKLFGINVDPKKIVMILNNIEDIDQVDDTFKDIFEVRNFGVNVAAEAVLSAEIFELLKNKIESVFDLSEPNPDFENQVKIARKNKDRATLEHLGEQQVLQNMAEAAVTNLTAVFKSTPIPAKLAEQAAIQLKSESDEAIRLAAII